MLILPFLILFVGGCVSTPPAAEMEVTGTMDKEKIRAVIRDHVIPIRHCYEKELKASPRLEGKLVLEWDIGELGKVTSVSVRKPVQVNLDDCVSAVIKSSLFESPPKGQIVRVVYPFVFHKDPEKAVK